MKDQQRPIDLSNKDVRAWIRHGPDKTLIEKAEKFGKALKDGKLSTSQIRQVFTKLKGIEAKGYLEKKVDFLMLKPFIAYAASRQDVNGLKLLRDRISVAIDEVVSAKNDEDAGLRFKNFVKFFEAVLAYHKAAGGK